MPDCIFCMIKDHQIPSTIIYEDDVCIAFLDLSQATRGHTLVISKTHYDSFLEADDQDLQHIITITKKLANQIKENLNANGINILTNAKEAAGQTVHHLHFHIIPRYDETDGFEPTFTNNQGKWDLEDIKQEIIKKY